MKVVRDGGGAVLQSALRKALGVSAATVSRMLKSLEALGLVVRAPSTDKRERDVVLTEEGRRRFDDATSELIATGAMDMSFAGALTPTEEWPRRQERARQALDDLDTIRRGFRDGAEDYVYTVSSWFCPDHPTQKKLGVRFQDDIEAIDNEHLADVLLLRQELAARRLY